MIIIFKKTNGFSLISLMIASSIGIFLVSGIIKVYIDSKSSFVFRSSVASANESARFALQDLQKNLVMAGRGIDAGNDSPNSYQLADNGERTFPDVDADGSTHSAGKKGIVDIDNLGSSIIAFRLAEGPKPCGKTGKLTALTKVRFYVNSKKELVCDDGTIASPMISGIERMRVLYGIETDSGTDTDGMPNVYLTATEVEKQNKWVSVVSIRIGLVVSSSQTIPSTFRPTNLETKNILNQVMTLPDKDHFFKSVDSTIVFRNLHASVKRQ